MTATTVVNKSRHTKLVNNVLRYDYDYFCRAMEMNEGCHFVGKKDDLIKAKRTFKTLEGRDVLILYHQKGFYALDYYCYRECTFCSGDVNQGSSRDAIANLIQS